MLLGAPTTYRHNRLEIWCWCHLVYIYLIRLILNGPCDIYSPNIDICKMAVISLTQHLHRNHQVHNLSTSKMLFWWLCCATRASDHHTYMGMGQSWWWWYNSHLIPGHLQPSCFLSTNSAHILMLFHYQWPVGLSEVTHHNIFLKYPWHWVILIGNLYLRLLVSLLAFCQHQTIRQTFLS